MADLRVETADGIATVTLDRPDALNALTIPVKQALIAAFASLAADRAVRAIILTGAGRAFCAGQDLRERLEPDAPSLDVELRDRYNPLVRAIRAAPQPVIAAVNGVAAGAGASIAFACDLRIAADAARFVLAFGQIGLIPDSGATWTLQRLVGASKAAEIALLNETLPAEEAARIGLVTRVVPAADLAAEARALAGRLAALSPGALARTKQALQGGAMSTFEEALELEARLQGEVGAHPDHAEGIAAFVEKRPPRFSG
jgi:2-(1,2-epoxy-1,2-dihydrophenyl)acetyl-CoA isomerase